ncbi:hypothetical protein GIB67_036749 [Kingdonia uniflora]|uniref:Protein FAR1-RELATED SEQUENCE n=1 Tax=Kingdonia uniflora TaxID=39325 RepID=A0A7J7LWX1_9MAGN|nr:hypothetical protein GIB67_036749 [Kingdonia uniflora]
MLTSVELMLERWKHFEEKEIEIFEEFKVSTADVISKTAFGSSYLEGAKIFENLHKLTAIVARNLHRIKIPFIGKLMKSSDETELEKVENGIRESFIHMIRRREEKMNMGELDGHGSDYLEFLTNWQEKAREEVIEIFKGKNPTPDDNGIAKLKTDEYVHTLDMFIDSIGQDGTLCEYQVSSFASRSRTVTFETAKSIVKYNCKKYEFLGILYAHALKVIHSKRLTNLPSSYYMKRWTKDEILGTLVDNNGEPVRVECYPSLGLQSSERTYMALKIARKGVSSTKCMEFTKGYLARVQEEVDDFLNAIPEEVTDLEGDENLSITKVGEVTNQDLACANITLHDEPRKKRNGKAGRIKGALVKGKGKKRTCPMQNGNPGGSNQESVRATTRATKKSLNSKVTTSSHAHEQHVDENVEPVMSHVRPNVYNEVYNFKYLLLQALLYCIEIYF